MVLMFSKENGICCLIYSQSLCLEYFISISKSALSVHLYVLYCSNETRLCNKKYMSYSHSVCQEKTKKATELDFFFFLEIVASVNQSK